MKKQKRRQWNITAAKLLFADDTRKLLDYIDSISTTIAGERQAMILWLLLNTGLRAGELCSLRVKDTPGVLGINAIDVYNGKGRKDRTIPLGDSVVKELTDYVTRVRPKTLPRHVRRANLNAVVFFSAQRRRYSPNGLYKMVRRAGVKAGISKRIRPHMLRHTFCTNALSKGADIVDTQQMMGHSSLTITAMYAHFKNLHGRGIGNQIVQERGHRRAKCQLNRE